MDDHDLMKPAKLILAWVLMVPVGTVGLAAQNKVEPIPSPLPTRVPSRHTAEPVPSVLPSDLGAIAPRLAQQVAVGQTEQQVIDLLGQPNQTTHAHVKGGDTV